MAKISDRLRQVLESNCAQTLSEIIQAKKKRDFESLRKLITAYPPVEAEYITKAIYVLGRWGNAEVVADIRGVVAGLDEFGRIAAVDALGRLGTPTALESVLEYAHDPSPEVRKFVIHALARFDQPEAQRRLKRIQRHESLEYLRNLAARYARPKET